MVTGRFVASIHKDRNHETNLRSCRRSGPLRVQFVPDVQHAHQRGRARHRRHEHRRGCDRRGSTVLSEPGDHFRGCQHPCYPGPIRRRGGRMRGVDAGGCSASVRRPCAAPTGWDGRSGGHGARCCFRRRGGQRARHGDEMSGDTDKAGKDRDPAKEAAEGALGVAELAVEIPAAIAEIVKAEIEHRPPSMG